MKRFYGSVTKEVDGKSYTFVMDMNAICAFDQLTGKNFFVESAGWNDEESPTPPSAADLRAIAWAALQAHHPQISIEEAGRILSLDLSTVESLMAETMKGVIAPEGNPKAARRK